MRPLRLKLAGLRSYRRPIEIEFDERTLVAIVGDTGAGKSSLLEGITFALYGASTWSGQAGDLISDYTTTMQVELTFLAGGERWRATRSMSKGGYPAPVHKLENLDSGERVNGRTSVNERVQQLVGLDCEGFLKTVVLPQGRFAQLLTETKVNRDRILKNIFRVDELEAIRDRAKKLRDELSPRLDALRLCRHSYLADPAATERDALRRLDQANTRLVGLRDLEQRLANLDEAAAEARREAEEVAGLVRVIDVRAGMEAAAQLAAIVGDEARLQEEVVAACHLVDTLDNQIVQVQGELQDAQTGDLTVATLTRVQSALDAFVTLRDDLVEAIDNLATHRREFEGLEVSAEELDAAASDASILAAKAGTRASETRLAAEEVAARFQEARNLVTAAGLAATAVEEARAEAQAASEAIVAAAGEVDRARAEEEQLANLRDEALQAKESSERAAAAAHAAEGLHTGDACPVCNRLLPDEFKPPRSRELGAAREAFQEAELRWRTATAAKTRAETIVGEATDRQAKATNAVAGREEALYRQLESLSHALGRMEQPEDLLDVLASPRLLSAMEREATRRRDVSTRAQEEATEASAKAAAMAAESRAKGGQLDEQRCLLVRHEGDARKLGRRLADCVSSILVPWRPTLPDLETMTAEKAGAIAGLRCTDVDQAQADVGDRIEKLDGLQNEFNELSERRNRATQALRSLEARRQRTVEQPAQQAINVLHGLVPPLTALGWRLGTRAQLQPPEPEATPTEASLKAEELARYTRDLLRTAERRMMADGDRVAAAETEATRLVASCGLDRRESVTDAKALAIADATSARADLDRARREGPIVVDLENRIARAEGLLRTLRLVHDKLADSAFIGHLITHRQEALLGVATSILADMTGERFGFTADFRVLDRLSGQPRSLRTLSGGESFLASLALALGMVELAARSGGRLDALFLDEGFGSLDASSLDAAIDALERRARAGQLVAVISHVRAVAERVPDVLAVRGTPTGTQVAWLTNTERIAAIDDELVASMAGLLE